MSETQSGKPLTLKGLLALVAAGILYLVSSLLGIDLTGRSGDADAGGASSEVGAAPEPGAPAQEERSEPEEREEESAPPAPEKRDDTALIRQLFQAMAKDRIVEAEGEIVHILPLDTQGSRHQNFLVELSNGITLKISHNIDLAPMVPNLRKGTSIRFHGEYEWNDKGGVVHWTHHDPRGRHEGGWLEYEGQRYE